MTSQTKFLELLDGIDSIQTIEFDKSLNSILMPELAWKLFSRNDVKALSMVDAEASKDTMKEWLSKNLKLINFAGDCYLSLGGFGDLPWLKVHFPNDVSGFFNFWNVLETKEMLLLSTRKEVLIGFIEEEYEYEAHVMKIEHDANISLAL